MKDSRPVNLDIRTIKMPITAVTSILHRASGLLLFLFIPFMLWTLGYSLSSASDFQCLQTCMSTWWMKLIIWIFMSALVYHIVAGIRHLLMDIGMGETLKGGRCGSYLVLFISFVLIVLMAVGIFFQLPW